MLINQHYIVNYNNSKAAKNYKIFQPARTLLMIHIAKPNGLRKKKMQLNSLSKWNLGLGEELRGDLNGYFKGDFKWILDGDFFNS